MKTLWLPHVWMLNWQYSGFQIPQLSNFSANHGVCIVGLKSFVRIRKKPFNCRILDFWCGFLLTCTTIYIFMSLCVRGGGVIFSVALRPQVSRPRTFSDIVKKGSSYKNVQHRIKIVRTNEFLFFKSKIVYLITKPHKFIEIGGWAIILHLVSYYLFYN